MWFWLVIQKPKLPERVSIIHSDLFLLMKTIPQSYWLDRFTEFITQMNCIKFHFNYFSICGIKRFIWFRNICWIDSFKMKAFKKPLLSVRWKSIYTNRKKNYNNILSQVISPETKTSFLLLWKCWDNAMSHRTVRTTNSANTEKCEQRTVRTVHIVRTTNSANSSHCPNSEQCEQRTVRTVHIVRTVRTANRANSSFFKNRRTGRTVRTGANPVRWSLHVPVKKNR